MSGHIEMVFTESAVHASVIYAAKLLLIQVNVAFVMGQDVLAILQTGYE